MGMLRQQWDASLPMKTVSGDLAGVASRAWPTSGKLSPSFEATMSGDDRRSTAAAQSGAQKLESFRSAHLISASTQCANGRIDDAASVEVGSAFRRDAKRTPSERVRRHSPDLTSHFARHKSGSRNQGRQGRRSASYDKATANTAKHKVNGAHMGQEYSCDLFNFKSQVIYC